jgi:hypothetical protein
VYEQGQVADVISELLDFETRMIPLPKEVGK